MLIIYSKVTHNLSSWSPRTRTLRAKCTLKGFKVHIPYRDSYYKGLGPLLVRVKVGPQGLCVCIFRCCFGFGLTGFTGFLN